VQKGREKQVFNLLVWLPVLCILSGCSFGSQWLDKLGFDTYDYMSETVHTTHDTDSELADELADMIRIISSSLVEFDSMGQAITAYRDSVLSYMLETEYARYSGNMALIEKAAKAYPGYQITQIIPAADFEATMYRYFGGSVKITHKDGSRFRYLKKVGAYISSAASAPNDTAVTICSLEETDKTYRVTFTVTTGTAVSDEYFVLIIKREDGTLYFKKLLKASEMKEENVPGGMEQSGGVQIRDAA